MSITREQLLGHHEKVCETARKLMATKNHDYAGRENSSNFDVFANFRRCEALGLCKTEVGIMVRLLDKMSRASTFIESGQLLVKEESVDDLVLDGINYWILFGAYVKEMKIANEKVPA